MADGIRCKNCGYCEADHIEWTDNPNEYISGYRFTLAKCPGYEVPKKLWALSRRLMEVARADDDKRKQLAHD